MKRKAEPIAFYLILIDKEYSGFKDDGLSFFPDWIFSRW